MNDDHNFSATSSGSRRWLWMLGSVALALVILLVWWNRRGPEDTATATEAAEKTEATETPAALTLDDEAQERIGLETVEAQLRPIGAHVRTTGIVAPNETRVAHIRALSTGVITAVMVRRGDRVKPGQPLLTYDNAELGQTVAGYDIAQRRE